MITSLNINRQQIKSHAFAIFCKFVVQLKKIKKLIKSRHQKIVLIFLPHPKTDQS